MSKRARTTSKPMSQKAVKDLIKHLNQTYHRIHTRYEKLFWTSYMGDHSVDERFSKAQIARETFRTNSKLSGKVEKALESAKGSDRAKLKHWQRFFSKYQTPEELKPLFLKIVELERKTHKKMASRKEGYTDPKSKKFVKASRAQMREIMATHDDEKVRKACFVALQELALTCTKELVKLVSLRNEYARGMGFDDFYDYKIQTEEEMSKAELFKLFDTIYDKTKYAFKNVRKMEKKLPGLRKPWNRGYLLAGDFTKESDKYYPFEKALERWGTSFQNLGISFHGGRLQLDLLDREGKYENGFCHWPELVRFEGKKRIPGSSNFTCNVVYGQVGSSETAYNTLFHEGGHAAHLLNSEETEACVNNEYPPASTAWDETQSMFLDTMFSSMEWTSKYAKSLAGEDYPFSLFERQVKKLRPLSPLSMNGISSVMSFERAIYEDKNLTEKKLIKHAKDVHQKFTDTPVRSVWLLSVPHIYSWESSCSYQGYGLATLALTQWREYFYKKYGYIVDNPKVGKEMRRVWKYASAKPFPECVKLATGKKLSPNPYLKVITADAKTVIRKAKQRIKKQQSIRRKKRPIDMEVSIKMVHGKKVVANNNKSFEDMAKRYAKWLSTQSVGQS